jgi:hypothetical protein
MYKLFTGYKKSYATGQTYYHTTNMMAKQIHIFIG